MPEAQPLWHLPAIEKSFGTSLFYTSFLVGFEASSSWRSAKRSVSDHAHVCLIGLIKGKNQRV